MDVTTLRCFVDVVRRGSFAGAARDRGVDPSHVSRTVAALEAELGVRLFQRTTRRLALTEAGAVYLDRIAPLVDELERARLQAIDAGRLVHGTLRVAAPVSFALLNVVPLLPEFTRRHPQLAIDLVLTDATLDLVAERIDVAIRLGDVRDGRLVARRLTTMHFRPVASPGYLARRGHPATPEALADHDCLLLDVAGFGDRWRFRGPDGRTVTVHAAGPVRSSNALALKTCALADMGILVQARWIVGGELRTGALVDVFPDHEVTAADGDLAFGGAAAWLVHPSRSYVPLKVQRFADHLQHAFALGPPGDRGAA